MGVDHLLAWKSLGVAAWFALLFTLERFRPAVTPRLAEPDARRIARNAALWLMNTLLSPLVVVPISVYAAANALPWRPAWWRGPAGLAADLLLLDFLIYWWHRANHVVPLLWRFHAVHHYDRFLDTTSAVRLHFGEVLLSAVARAMAILVLAIPVRSVLAFEALVLTGALFHHSNIRVPPALESALSRIVVTPAIHWVHHHRVRADTDSNYSTILSLWDPLFRSRSPHRRSADMAIGVEALEERPLLRLLLAPFR